MDRRRRLFAAALGVGAGAISLSHSRVPDGVPFSPVVARGRVGADFVDRTELAAEGTVRGEMDDLSAYARPGFDPDAVAPAVRRFYEETADYRMAYRVRWHRGFRLGAAAATRLTSRLRQLNLPGPGDAEVRHLESRFVPLRTDCDPRDGARAWIRTDAATGNAVFVALYASHVHDGIRDVNIAVPLPYCNLSTVLRPEQLDAGGVELTTRRPGHPGLYLVTRRGAAAAPMDQRFRVWPSTADAPAPDSVRSLARRVDRDTSDDCDAVLARHAMWVLGQRFLTVDYVAGRSPLSRSRHNGEI
ncbi:hypothetical protein [Salinirarus marinus]